MAISNYREVEKAIGNLKKFNHGSCHATFNGGTSYDTYSVYSYSTLILRIIDRPHEKLYIEHWDGDYYSRTTSRLQNIIRRQFPQVSEKEGK